MYAVVKSFVSSYHIKSIDKVSKLDKVVAVFDTFEEAIKERRRLEALQRLKL